MKKVFFISVFVVLFGLVFLPMHAYAKQPGAKDWVAGRVLVKFKDGTPQQVKEKEVKQHGGKIAGTIASLDVQIIQVADAAEEKVVAALGKNPHVAYAELDYIAEALLTPNDGDFSKQWGLENTGQDIQGQVGTVDADIDAPEAWNITSGSAAIKVAILDTGIDQDHEDLVGKIVSNSNFTDSPSVDDFYGHGTHVGGIVFAKTNNSLGVAGGCPLCVGMNVKVLNDGGSGAYSWIANGITDAANNGAKVINMSLGGSFPSRTLERAVNSAWSKGVVIVAAAGNSGNSSKTYPGAYTNVIAVAATNNKDQKASFSSYGVKWVDVAAPGQDVFSTFPNHPFVIGTNYGLLQNYDFASGTSMATPMTSAVAGLLWASPYGTSNTSVRNRLESTAEKIEGTGTYWIHGRVNAYTAVAP